MGMFDTIYVKSKLPLTEELSKLDIRWDEIDFQTKSLENCMSTYTITEEGDLVTFQDAWWEENSLKRDPVKVPCHGKILFYNYLQDVNGYDWFIDFNAYFIYGKLDKIELENVDKTPIQERLVRESLWKHDLEERQKKVSYKIKQTLRKIPGYGKTLRSIGKFANWLGDKVYMISIRWS